MPDPTFFKAGPLKNWRPGTIVFIDGPRLEANRSETN